MRIKNQMIYLLEMWAKIKSRWAKIPKWMRIVIGVAFFVLAIYVLPVFHSSKKEFVDSHIHEKASTNEDIFPSETIKEKNKEETDTLKTVERGTDKKSLSSIEEEEQISKDDSNVLNLHSG